MNEAMIDRWNSKVGKKDTIYHLGDFAIKGKAEEIEVILERLKGKKHLIIGNHDANKTRNAKGWESVQHYLEINIRGIFTCLFHYPIISWNKKNHGSIHLHGHTHFTLPPSTTDLRLEVGVDGHNFTPLSDEDIFNILSQRPYWSHSSVK